MAASQATIRNPRHTTPKAIVALLLTFTAGFVDIVGLLTIYQLFTAHMTGTTVHLGEQLIRRNWPAAVVAASIVAAFLCWFGNRANHHRGRFSGNIPSRCLRHAAARVDSADVGDVVGQ